MKRVLFISPDLIEQSAVQEAARTHEGGPVFDIQTTASFGQEASWWAANPVDLLVLKLPDDEPLQAYFFVKLKADVPKSLPLVLLTKAVSQSLLQLSPHFAKVRIVKTPVSGFYLFRTMLDITTDWEPGKRQIHPRYVTEQPIRVSQIGNLEKTASIMRNLSVGGAYIEIPPKSAVYRSNDMIKIEISLPQGNFYEFDAKVVWAKVKEDGTHGYGCTFVDAAEIYENLLKGFKA